MLTPIKIEDVLSWLEQFDDDAVIGYARDATCCPFSCFLGSNWFVYASKSIQEDDENELSGSPVWIDRKGVIHENPEWMTRCIDYIDSIDEADDKITKKQFYDALRERS